MRRQRRPPTDSVSTFYWRRAFGLPHEDPDEVLDKKGPTAVDVLNVVAIASILFMVACIVSMARG